MTERAHGQPTEIVEHYFRHEYGRLVSTLVRVFGVHWLETIEDSIQDALRQALASWSMKGAPENPGAWLYRVAYNGVLDVLRSNKVRARDAERHTGELPEYDQPPPRFDREIEDDQLRMLFVCCDERVPVESQLVLALKTLCGFSVGEIAAPLFISEANVRKRLERARDRLRDLQIHTDTPDRSTLEARLGSVHAVIYLLFNAGYHSSQPDIVRRDLCDEAIRLGLLLAQHEIGAVPSTSALVALMHFHAARLNSRVDNEGRLLLLDEQDRARWDQELISRGCEWLKLSAKGERFSRYHAEAGIAVEHCLAPNFESTRWGEIAELYGMLEQLAPSPLHVMNRAVAVAQFRGAEAALALLTAAQPPEGVLNWYLWQAVLGELHRNAGHFEVARTHLTLALEGASEAERGLIRARISRCERRESGR
jgi:RNA polymerase sigma factor (sigma-70 family)